MTKRPLVVFREAVLRAKSGLEIGPIEWSLHRGERVRLEAAPEVIEALFAVLTGADTPLRGTIEELNPAVVQADFLLREKLNGNHSIGDFLASPDAPRHVWLENRRRAPGVLLDTLGLQPRAFRLPLKLQTPEVVEKFLAFRFLVSRADLLLGREIFESDSPEIGEALRRRWTDFPGAVVAAVPRERLLGRADVEVRIGADGDFSHTVLPAETR